MLSNLFGKFSKAISSIFSKKPVSILSDTELESAIFEDDDELRSILRDELNDYYNNENLVRDYELVTLTRTRIYTDPQFVTLEKNQQLAARVILVGVDGRKFTVDVFFKIGEKFTQESYYRKIAGELKNDPLNNMSRSEYVRLATIEENFYIQSWVKK